VKPGLVEELETETEWLKNKRQAARYWVGALADELEAFLAAAAT
jgi:hypothetical protein